MASVVSTVESTSKQTMFALLRMSPALSFVENCRFIQVLRDLKVLLRVDVIILYWGTCKMGIKKVNSGRNVVNGRIDDMQCLAVAMYKTWYLRFFCCSISIISRLFIWLFIMYTGYVHLYVDICLRRCYLRSIKFPAYLFPSFLLFCVSVFWFILLLFVVFLRHNTYNG